MEAAEVMHGSQGDRCNVLTLDEDEFITGIEGFAERSCVNQLTFITNNRSFTSFIYPITAEQERLMQYDVQEDLLLTVM